MKDESKNIDGVVKDGLCIGCGTCAGICPRDAVEMVIDWHKGIYFPEIQREKCNECSLCFQVCPGHGVDFKQLNTEIFGNEPEDFLLGNYFNCYIGHATDYDIRYNSASGGLVTTLLIFALEEGLIDGALVTRMREDNPLEPQPFIAKTREEIISARGSKYCPVSTNSALKEIINAMEGEKFAVVGLPCHINGIRKAESANKKLKAKIVVHFGLMCHHTPSFRATEYILHKLKVQREEVNRLDYRGEGWLGGMTIKYKNGMENFIPQNHAHYWGGAFGQFFFLPRCLMCSDKVCKLADFSLGDALLPEVLNCDKVGSSLLVSRTRIGEEILSKALLYGENIELKQTQADKVEQSQELRSFAKRSAACVSLFKKFGKITTVDNGNEFYNLNGRVNSSITYYLKVCVLYWNSLLSSKLRLGVILSLYIFFFRITYQIIKK